jgi:hypothetical protein
MSALVFDKSCVHFRHQRTVLPLIVSLNFCSKMSDLLNLGFLVEFGS